jgi:hypothetical protein
MPRLINETGKKFFACLLEDIISYFRLYDYAKLKAKAFLEPVKQINSVASFWYGLLGDRFVGDSSVNYIPLCDGNTVRVKDVFLSEWAPKLPGQIWTMDGVRDYTEGQKRIYGSFEFNDKLYEVLDPWGKFRVVSAGYGSVRINRNCGTKDNFMYMALVGKERWECDCGIPVVVSEAVFKEYQRFAEKGAPWIESAEGILHINEDLPFKEFVPKAIGSSLSPETESTLRYRPNLPKCFVHLVSPLSLIFRYNDSHPRATAWTIFNTPDSMDHNGYGREEFRYTYASFNPSEKGSITEAVKFLQWYAEKFKSKGFVTDFDGQIPRLESRISIQSDPITRQRRQASKMVAECDKWISNLLKE